MSQEAERVYTINLGKVWLSPNNQRAKRAINMIREFTEHHMKTGQVKIDQDLSQAVWKRGIRSPPRKIRVKMAKTDDGYVLVSPYEEEKKVDEKKVEAPKAEKKTEKPETKVDAKVEAKVEAPKAQKKAEEKPKKEEKKAEEKKPKKEKVPSKKSVKKAARKKSK